MRPPTVCTVRALSRAAAVAALTCALLGTGAVTAAAAPGSSDGSGSQGAGNWQDQGGNGSGQGHGNGNGNGNGAQAHRPAPAPAAHPTPKPTSAPTPPPKPAPGGEQDGQWPPLRWHPRPEPPVTGTSAHLPAAQPAAVPKAPAAPRPAAPAQHADTPPAGGPGPGSSPAMVLALAASAPLVGIGARIAGIGGVVPLPGWGPLRSSLLTGGPGATAVLGGIVLAGSAVLGLGAYACTRLRRRLARLW